MSRRDHVRLSPALLNECLRYDSFTGLLFWKSRPRHHFKTDGAWKVNNARQAGRVAGSTALNGYQTVQVNQRAFYAHRVAWVLHTGADIPEGFLIDHINGDRSDNRIINLRLASSKLNAENCRTKEGKRLPRGVFWDKSRRRLAVYVASNRKMHFGGRFDDVSLAEAAAVALRGKLHGGSNAP